jgi:hypothetical protein
VFYRHSLITFILKKIKIHNIEFSVVIFYFNFYYSVKFKSKTLFYPIIKNDDMCSICNDNLILTKILSNYLI